jgi:hypothetical protein
MGIENPFEYSCPEDRELAERIWQMGGLLPGGPEVDWEKSRKRCSEVLREIIRGSPESSRLTALFDGVKYEVGGDEHHIVEVASEPERVYKITHGDSFGCRSYFSPHADPSSFRHFHGEFNADPFFYLFRWLRLNAIGAFKTRFEGFIPSEKPNWLPRICVSQPKIPTANPTPEEIRASLGNYGFLEVSEAVFFEPDTISPVISV